MGYTVAEGRALTVRNAVPARDTTRSVEATIVVTRQERAKEAIGRAENAQVRAKAALDRIVAAQLRINASDYPNDEMGVRARVMATAQTEHQRSLCTKSAERCRVWLRKAVRRAARNTEDTTTFTKIIRYVWVCEKAAHLCETQAYWAEHYTNDPRGEAPPVDHSK